MYVFIYLSLRVLDILIPLNLVAIMMELFSSGMSIEEILDDYEDLERADLLAVLAYATRLSQVKRIEMAQAA